MQLERLTDAAVFQSDLLLQLRMSLCSNGFIEEMGGEQRLLPWALLSIALIIMFNISHCDITGTSATRVLCLHNDFRLCVNPHTDSFKASIINPEAADHNASGCS